MDNTGETNHDLNTLFDKVFVLTIERNFDRHDNVRKILHNLNFEFWYGLDARLFFTDTKYVEDIEESFFRDQDIDRKFASGSTLGQFGAYYSIKKMIDFAANGNLQTTLIFEDDLLPIKGNWEKILWNAMQELPFDWDILLLGYLYDGRVYKQAYYRYLRGTVKAVNSLKRLFSGNKNAIPKLPVRFSSHLDKSGYSTGGQAFCISKKGARILQKHLSPMRDSGDLLISRLILENKLNAYSVYPCLFLQNALFPSKTIVI
jgi:GR25 family glycosyltransferase involved in LPS biosynthesis